MRIVHLRGDPWSKEIDCTNCGATLEITTNDLDVGYVVPELTSKPHYFTAQVVCLNCKTIVDVREQVPWQVLKPLVEKAEKSPISGPPQDVDLNVLA